MTETFASVVIVVWNFSKYNLGQEIQMLKRDMNIADYDADLFAASPKLFVGKEHIELIASETTQTHV